MLGVFDIKKKSVINKKNDLFSVYTHLSKATIDELYSKYKTDINGLDQNEARDRLTTNGYNTVIKDDKKPWIYFFLLAFKDQFILILFFLAFINCLMGDNLGSFIIIGIAIVSASIRFIQDYSVYLFNRKLKSKIYTSTIVLRDKEEKTIRSEQIVIGDIVKLNAGSLIPADLMLIDSKDLFVNQSVFTGESIPVEKDVTYDKSKNIFELSNICLMGSNVISGTATALVVNTGFNTYLGMMSKELNTKRELTNFEKGMNKITGLLIRYMLAVCLFVLIVNGMIKGDFKEALLFALSVAVGITPSMLPMIVNVNLTKGSRTLAKKKTLVKKIESIQNLGAIDVLCTDKTGTLTENNIVLQKYIDINGKENIDILEYAYLNSFFSTGVKNIIDRAIISYGKKNDITHLETEYVKVDEIPFDYSRKKTSVIVKKQSSYRMITKGALEEVLKNCTKVKNGTTVVELTKDMVKKVETKAQELASTGMQVIALATKREYPGKKQFDSSFENEMIFVGFVAFLDPPKKDAPETLKKLEEIGITTKILTGDNPYATKSICDSMGIFNDGILLGDDIDKMDDIELSKKVEEIDIFARMNPLQKERIVRLLKENNHVVGFMGDGVNDAPSLHLADIGISVNTATDIAKEASDIILLERSLKVIYAGVIEGRKVYGNIIKYMKMALSADFGDVFSIMIASIFLPFLPLLPIQMLIQDFIYDFSQIGIPYDNVDKEFLVKPHRWNTKGISSFMKVMGITSSVIDVLSFLVFWFVLGYNTIDKQANFQTAWFVTCLITELMIIYNVRTAKNPITQSHASKVLFYLTILSGVLTLITPYLLQYIPEFNYVILPPIYYLYLFLLVVSYFLIVSIIKKIYIKRHGEWL